MLRPRPIFCLQISIVESLPGITGQLRGSKVTGADPCFPMRQVCTSLKDEEIEEDTGGARDESGEREQGRERGVGGGREKEEEKLLERLMESLTAA